MGLQHPTIGRKDIDHAARSTDFPAGGGDDVALRVETHAVDATMGIEIVQHLMIAQRAIVTDGIGAQFALLAVAILALGDIECLLIR